MGDLLTAGLFRQMLRSATPVGLAAMGGLMTEHAGIMNIGMAGMILLGAFTAVAVSWLAGSAWLGLAAAILVGILAGLFFALFVVKLKSDEFIIGTALNIFAGGLTVFLLRALFQIQFLFACFFIDCCNQAENIRIPLLIFYLRIIECSHNLTSEIFSLKI